MNKERLLALVKDVSPRYLVALYLVLVLAVGLAVSSLVLYPQETRIEALTLQLNQENQKLATVENFVLAHPNMEQYMNDLQQALMRADNALPGSLDMSVFLSQLEKYARESGVKLTNVKPAAAAERAGYREMQVEVSVEGSYFPTMSFLKKLEDGSRFCMPTAFLIQNKQGVLATRFNLQIFSYGVAPRPGAPPAVPRAQAAPAVR